jgi:prepilin-type N-terminal cleavage/methylation domain-containing protein
MQTKLKNKRGFDEGFTLIEILFAVGIFVLIAGAIAIFSTNIWTSNSFIGIEINSINAGRLALRTMITDIRTASSANTGAYAISAATATSFTFYSDIFDDGLKEKIRYFLNGTSLQQGIIKPTGSPLTYNAGAEVITTLVSNVTNASIFSYYDKNYDGTTAALATPVDVSLVRLVKITITTDPNPNRSPSPATFTSVVSIRNLKDNL